MNPPIADDATRPQDAGREVTVARAAGVDGVQHAARSLPSEPAPSLHTAQALASANAGPARPPRAPETNEASVSKPNEALAIRPKRGRLTLLSRRIYNVLLYHAQQQGVERPQYRIALAELIDDARFTSNNTALLKTHIRDMQATTIEWHTSAGGARQWTSTQLLGTVVIEEPGRGSPCYITWTYPEAIRERLVRPSHYTRILLEMSAQMRSYAAAVLYEIGARYLTSPGRLTMREDTVWWASVLTGRSDITTVDYRILRRDTVKKALAELDTLCDEFSLEAIEHKRGRKVEELQFRVLPKAQVGLGLGGADASGRTVFDLQLVERIEALGFKRADAQDLYASTDEGALRAAVEHTEARLKAASLPPLKSPAAYLRDALKRGYAGARGEGDDDGAPGAPGPRPPATAAGRRAARAPERLPPGERLQRLRDEWRHQRIVEARSLFEEMPEPDRRSQIERFESERVPELAAPIARAWRRDGIASRVAASSFFAWLADLHGAAEPTDRDLLELALGQGP